MPAGQGPALHPSQDHWKPPVLTCSALDGSGVDEVWNAIQEHRSQLIAANRLTEKRTAQRLRWMWDLVDDRLVNALRDNPAVDALRHELEASVRLGQLPPTTAAHRLFDAFMTTPAASTPAR